MYCLKFAMGGWPMLENTTRNIQCAKGTTILSRSKSEDRNAPITDDSRDTTALPNHSTSSPEIE